MKRLHHVSLRWLTLACALCLGLSAVPVSAQPTVCDPAEIWEARYSQQDVAARLQEFQVVIEVRFITVSNDFFDRIGVDFDFDVNSADCDPEFNSTPAEYPTGNTPTPLPNPFRSWNFFGLPETTGADFAVFQLNTPEEKDDLLMAVKSEPGASIRRIDWKPQDGEVAVLDDPANDALLFGLLKWTGMAVTLKHAVATDDPKFWVSAQPVLHGVVPAGGFSNVDGEEEDVVGDVEAEFPDNPQAPVRAATHVVVSDGQTIVLGGLVRQPKGSDGASQLLSKIPYVNRLFQNVGYGRETETLMLMVTPRIIIQEEEEE